MFGWTQIIFLANFAIYFIFVMPFLLCQNNRKNIFRQFPSKSGTLLFTSFPHDTPRTIANSRVNPWITRSFLSCEILSYYRICRIDGSTIRLSRHAYPHAIRAHITKIGQQRGDMGEERYDIVTVNFSRAVRRGSLAFLWSTIQTLARGQNGKE